MIVLPVGHEQTSVRRLPWATFGLMGLCVAVFLVSNRSASISGGTDTLALWGLVPAKPAPVTLLTHMFLHVGWYHLIGNLLILYLAGPFIEDRWGRPLFTAFYLASGLSGALFHIGGNPGATTPMVGASGAIAGVMGAFLVRYGATKVRFFYLFMLALRGTFSIPAWVLLPFWFVQQLVWAVLDSGGGVAYWAHVGGFACGVAGAQLMRSLSAEERWIEPVLRDKIDTSVLNNAAVEHGLAVRAEGKFGQAIARLRQAVECQPDNPDAARALWSVALEQGQQEKVAPLLLRSIASQLRSGESGPALDLWAEVLKQLPDVRAEQALLLWIARLLADDERNDDARATLGKAMRQQGPQTPPAFALRLARIAQFVDPVLALSAVELSLADPDLDPGSRREAEALRGLLTPVEIPVAKS